MLTQKVKRSIYPQLKHDNYISTLFTQVHEKTYQLQHCQHLLLISSLNSIGILHKFQINRHFFSQLSILYLQFELIDFYYGFSPFSQDMHFLGFASQYRFFNPANQHNQFTLKKRHDTVIIKTADY